MFRLSSGGGVVLACLLSAPLFACEVGPKNAASCGSNHWWGPDWTDQDPTCAFYPVEHADACGADCPILVDVELRCEGDGLPTLDASVAAGADATYVGTDTGAWQNRNLRPELFRVNSEQDIEAISVEPGLDFTGVLLAPAPDGSVHLVAHADGSQAGFRYGEIEGDALVTETIPGANHPVPSAFLFDGMGNAHFWTRLAGDAVHNTRAPDGTWDSSALSYSSPIPADLDFGLSYDGSPVVAQVASTPDQSEWSLTLDEGDRSVGLGAITPTFGQAGSSVWSMAAPAFPASDSAVVGDAHLKHRPSQLELAWVTPDAVEQTLLDNTTVFSQECELDRVPEGSSCGTRCVDNGGGVQQGTSALARSADGRLWVAWLDTQLDRTVCYHFTPKMPEQTFRDTCTAGWYEDNSLGEIVLATFDVETRDFREVLRVPTAAPAPVWAGDLPNERGGAHSYQTLSLSTYGTRLSLAARVDHVSPSLRVIEVDTSLVP